MSEQVEFKPAEPVYGPSLTVSERIREEVRLAASGDGAAALVAGTSGTLVDNGTDRWRYMVVPGTPGVLTIQLMVSERVTWWKAIEISASFFGSWYPIRHLETKNDNRSRAVDLTPADAQSNTLKLDFWRGGVLGFGAYIFTYLVDVPSNMGNRIIFLCDSPEDIRA